MNPQHQTSFFSRFLTGTGLPLFLLSATLVYEAFLLAIVFAPDSTSAWGGFTREFKLWCFNFDPDSGAMEWLQVAIMLLEPLFISGIALFLWKQPLMNITTRAAWFGQWRTLFSGAFTGIVVVTGLFIYGKPSADVYAALPFPGERIRTRIEPPAFQFVDQKGHPFRLEESHGRVVLITGIYTACSSTCPQILLQTKILLDSLPEESQAKLDVVALSLSPEYDTASMMDRLASAYGFLYPQFRYLNGDPDLINDTVKKLGFSKSVDSETGVINHANLFLVVDAKGKIAYRLTLDGRQKEWLKEAVQSLTVETEKPALAVSLR